VSPARVTPPVMRPLRRRISASTADDDRAGVDGFAA
jgi:hypothetical protein